MKKTTVSAGYRTKIRNIVSKWSRATLKVQMDAEKKVIEKAERQINAYHRMQKGRIKEYGKSSKIVVNGEKVQANNTKLLKYTNVNLSIMNAEYKSKGMKLR